MNSFDNIKQEVMTLVALCMKDDSVSIVDELMLIKSSDSSDMCAIVDYCFRETLRKMQERNGQMQDLEKILDLCCKVAIKDLCSVSSPVLLLSDIFDTCPISTCESLFCLVEKRVSIWKQEKLFSGCKNHLLRCCNDLLRRLSRSQNTVFCGRILMFLATLFPLSERSGLNIASEFNIDNKTAFALTDDGDLSDNQPDIKSADGGPQGDSKRGSGIAVDYNLYRKFWELQEYFREPNQLYSKILFKKFTSYSNDVMAAFDSFKIDHVKSSSWRSEGFGNSDKAVYFAKYLTSPKLLDLEMADTNFRRYILVQFLILYQYLMCNAKFKTEKKLSLTDDQSTWVSNAQSRVYKLLEDTPPDGANFVKCTKHMLSREEQWNNWKNEGCPTFESFADKSADNDAPKKPTRKRRPPIGNVIREATLKKKILMGNTELTRLWNLCADNMQACTTETRNFMPTVDAYFEDAIEQLKPEHQIEDQYKLIYDSNFGWKALRLLARQSHHFFTHNNQPSKSLPSYLENMIHKIAKEMPQNYSKNDMADNDAEMAGNAPDSDDELLKSYDSSAKNSHDADKEAKSALVSTEMIPELAQNIGPEWKKLAPKLKFQQDEILFIESEHSASVTEQARKMLNLWTENEADDASIHNLRQAAISVQLTGTVIDILHKLEPSAGPDQSPSDDQ